MEEIDDRPWMEKYRPKTLTEMVGHETIVKSLKIYIQQGNFPHLIFAGPAGTGKTSAAHAFANDLFNGRILHDSFLEVNASDQGRIGEVREIITDFVSQKSVIPKAFKIILLDEADRLKAVAQAALRRIMETGDFHVRFILTCNYPNNIIPPILSRSSTFRFPRLTERVVVDKLKQIIAQEHDVLSKELPPEIFSQIYKLTRGDMRQAVTLLQVIAEYSREELLVGDSLYELAGYLRPSFLNDFISQVRTKSFTEIQKTFIENYSGKSSRNVLLQILALLLGLNLKKQSLADLIDKIATYDYSITQGATEQLQISGLIASLSEYFKS